jgi:hypothetical protein
VTLAGRPGIMSAAGKSAPGVVSNQGVCVASSLSRPTLDDPSITSMNPLSGYEYALAGGDMIPGIPNWALLAGAGLAAFLVLKR